MSQWKWMILWAVKGNINPTMIKMKQKEKDNGRYFSDCEILVVILVRVSLLVHGTCSLPGGEAEF